MPQEMRSNSGSDIVNNQPQQQGRQHTRQVSGFSTDTSVNNVSCYSVEFPFYANLLDLNIYPGTLFAVVPLLNYNATVKSRQADYHF